MAHTLIFYMALLLAAAVLEPLAQRLRIPFAVVLILLGFGASEWVVSLGFDTGLRWDAFNDLIFFVFLPALIFEAAFNLKLKLLWQNLHIILTLAIPMMLLSAAITGSIIYYAIGHPTGFPWVAALLLGAMLSATDPVAVLALFKQVGAPDRLSVLTDGESLFNDATAVVLFVLLIGLATHPEQELSATRATLEFLRIFFGGVLAGLIVGGLIWLLRRSVSAVVSRGILTLVAAYGSFMFAETFHVSGVMAALIAGLMLGHMERRLSSAEQLQALHSLWEYKAWIANAVLFLLSGISVQLSMFTDQWLAILIGIAAVLISRAIGIFTFIPLLGKIPGIEPIPRNWTPVLYWGGVRGAVTLALALSLPIELEYWWTVQSVAYGVVLFTLFFQAPTMGPLMNRLKV